MVNKTLSPDNQALVQCPVFAAKTKIRDCFTLRDMVWRGDKPIVRQGCQCALLAGKCPIPVILRRMIRTGADDYHAAEPKVISIQTNDLDQISKVLVLDSQMKRHSLSAVEEKKLLDCNEAARKSKPMISKRKPERIADMASVETPAVSSDIIEAATTGDLGAAINTSEQSA